MLFAVVGGCGQNTELSSVSSSLEAGTPPTPVYTRLRNDDVTGDNTPVVVTGSSANCTPAAPCYIADPGADSYANDEFERPAGQGAAAVNYLPSIDITRGDTGLDANWVFYKINLYGVQPGQTPNAPGSLPHFYGIEMNFDNDPQGDLILEINQPSLNVGTTWGTTGLQARLDQNNTMGGPRPLVADGPGQAGGGYEHRVFDGGQNFQPGQPGGSTAVQARINGAAVEIALYRPFLQTLTADPITSFGFRPYAAAAQVSTSELYTHDDANRIQIGSPYPWLAVAGAPATCPNGSSGDDGLTAAQVTALESGTNINTGIKNPCYASGGIYQRDNAGTVTQLAGKDDLSAKVDLALTKTDAPDPATQNGTLVYTLRVTNTMPTIVTGIVVTDPLPASVTYVTSSTGCTYNALAHTVTCTAASIAGNQVAMFTITVSPMTLGSVTNSATVTSDGEEKTPANNTATATTTVVAACGNGQLDPGEGCDDGNTISGDGCEANCTLPNGAPCTTDNQCNSGACDELGSHTCEPANTCGNGTLEPLIGEACDDGNTTSGDGCEANCKLPIGAPCTTDNQCNSGACDELGSHTCEPANTCGNGTLEPAIGEACDDGNTVSGDGCEADCKLPNGSQCQNNNQCDSGICNNGTCQSPNTCGNGVLDAGEVCDDGNTIGGDTCEADCRLPNGAPCTSDGQCHSGTCDELGSHTCEPANTCGNGTLDNAEACDDGNTTSGDGCEADCKLPDGATCSTDQQCHSGVCDTLGSHTCEPANTCGNGKLETGEGCDDGGVVAGDGCNATCLIEDGHACNQDPAGSTGDSSCTSNLCDTEAGLPGTCGGLDTDGDGVFDHADIDDDNDGILDTTEGDGMADTDGDGAADSRDLDSDNDGIADATEVGHRFPDRDGDFLADCPTGVGANGYCDALETSVDSGQPDFDGIGPSDGTPRDTDQDQVPDYRDLDTDNDGIADLQEAGTKCADSNDDGICDGNDLDKDGIVSSLDASPTAATRFGTADIGAPTETDGDGTPDYRDLDSDADTVFDILESKNAGLDANKDGVIDATADRDNDGVRDVADDSDLDGKADSEDADPPKFGGLHDSRIFSDTDGTPDFQDPDADNDGVGDGGDNCRITHNPDQSDLDGDHIGDVCDTGDGRSWGIQGAACGCDSTQSSPTSLLFVLGALGLVIGRRRRRTGSAALLLLGLVALPGVGHAQVVTGDFSTERMQLATDHDGILDVESGAIRPHLTFDLALWLGYANDPLILNRTDMGTEHVGALVSDQVSGELVGAVGLFDRAQVGLAIPLVFSQQDSIPAGGMTPTAPASSFAVGDIRIIPKYRLMPQADFGVDLSLYVALGLPSRSGDGFSGDKGFSAAPALALSRRFESGLRGAVNVGYRAREKQTMYDLEVNDEVFAGIGAAQTLGPAELDAGFSMATAANDMFGSFNRNYAELKVGAGYDLPGPLAAFAATGFGVAQGYGTPDWRALAGIRVDRENKQEEAAPSDIPDTDHDGFPDNIDKCPTEPEDVDQFEDTDGCPDTDDDKDGIPDVSDKCRMEPEDKDSFEDEDGCPDTDNDHDTILDVTDKCPMDPEDLDKFQDDDGCPDPDNDGDTVADAQDRCPETAGAVDNQGCPWPDTDGDGIIDKFDNCPKWKGVPEHQGCNIPQLVKITETKLELYDTTFFATNKSTIQKRSFKLLNNVAEVIRNHTDLKIAIEGHTDDRGSDAWNLKLSQARADAVKDYLVKRGVPPDQVTAAGFGEARPIADNKTAKGRAANRRVEFLATRVIETTQTVQPTTAPATPAPAPAPAPPPPPPSPSGSK